MTDMQPSEPPPAVAVVGAAGAMGRAAVYDLCCGPTAGRRPRVLLLDSDLEGARRAGEACRGGATFALSVDASDAAGTAERLAGCAVVINCAPYTLNLFVMEAALRAHCHYVDLGGLFHTTRRQLEWHRRFEEAGLLAVLGMGSAPGIVNVLAAAAAAELKTVKSVRIYNGGRDKSRRAGPPTFPFSPATLLDEFTQPAMVFTRGRFQAVPALTGGESFDFPGGRQQVHYSLHSEVATLPFSLADKGIRECAFKIAYDPAVTETIKLLIDLGLAGDEPVVRGVRPREMLTACLRRATSSPGVINDCDSLAVVVEGSTGKGTTTIRYDVTAGSRRRPPLSAVACDTGFPAAIAALMIMDGRITARGVLPPELCVPTAPFLTELAKRGMRAVRRVRRGRRG